MHKVCGRALYFNVTVVNIERYFKEIQIHTYNVANPETREVLFLGNNALYWVGSSTM